MDLSQINAQHLRRKAKIDFTVKQTKFALENLLSPPPLLLSKPPYIFQQIKLNHQRAHKRLTAPRTCFFSLSRNIGTVQSPGCRPARTPLKQSLRKMDERVKAHCSPLCDILFEDPEGLQTSGGWGRGGGGVVSSWS